MDSTIRCNLSHNDKDSQSVKSPCPHCGKLFKSIKIHISKAHPQEYRKTIVSTYDISKEKLKQSEYLGNANSNNDNAGCSFVNNADIHENNHPCIKDSNNENIRKHSDNTDSLLQFNKNAILEFEKAVQDLIITPNIESLNTVCVDICEILSNAVHSLPGPKHPAIRYYN